MKKNLLYLIIVISILFGCSSISLADDNYKVQSFVIDRYELTNPNPDNPKLYVLLTWLEVSLSNGQEDLGMWDIYTLNDFSNLGISLDEYEVLSSGEYNPKEFDFSNDNVIRVITPYAKTQDDFNRFYYRSNSDQWGMDYHISRGVLEGTSQANFNRNLAIYDLNEYFKLPGAEKTIVDLYQIGDEAEDFIAFAKDYANFDDTKIYSDSHLYSCSILVELEKKPNELPVPKGDFIKALNEMEFCFRSHRPDYTQDDYMTNLQDHISLWDNIVDLFNDYYKDTRWAESYVNNGSEEYGVVEFWGTQPTDIDVRAIEENKKWTDKEVYAKFIIPYTKEDGYVYYDAYDPKYLNREKVRYAYLYSFKKDGEFDPYAGEHDSWIYVDNTRKYIYHYEDKRIEKVK